MSDLDLFGGEVPTPPKPVPDRPPINDMDLVQAVLAAAVSPGYRLVGAHEKVYRCGETRTEEIEPVPSYEDVAVHQLIDARWLEIGGNHRCTYRQSEGHGRSVLVPKRSKEALARWRAYKRPSNWSPAPHDAGHSTRGNTQGPAPPTPRVLITGSREWTDVPRMRAVLAHWRQRCPNAVLVHGDARGADRLAKAIWESWGGATEAHPADWNTHGRRAGYLRNQAMIDSGATVCLAFIRNHSRGATHTATQAQAANIPTVLTEHND